MSFALRGGLVNVGESLLPKLALPSLPALSLPSFLQRKSKQTIQDKLNELSDALASRDSGLPFFNDNGILLAAPKKKTSHMKRRQRLYCAGRNQIKLNNNLNRCPACGHYKRSHFICMNCMGQIRKYWKNRDAAELPGKYEEKFTNPVDEEVLYPGKTERPYDRQLRKKEYLVRRPKTLPVE